MLHKFQKGDIVRVISRSNSHGYKVGGEYTVERTDPRFTTSEPGYGFAYNLKPNDAGICNVIREIDMELVKPREPLMRIDADGITIRGNTSILTKQEMEEKEMKNEVLELWYKRENAKLKSEFKSEIEKYVNEHPIVVKYKEIVSEFTDSMTALLAEYVDSEDFNIVSSLSYSVLDDVDLRDIEKKLQDMYLKDNVAEHENMLSKLQDTYETIKAMLSLSDDLEYQLDVLSKYKVIDKKTKKMVD